MKKLLCFILIFSLIFTLAVPHASAEIAISTVVGIVVGAALATGFAFASSGTSSQSFNDYMGEQVENFVDSRGATLIDTFGTGLPEITHSGLTIPHRLMNGALDFLDWWKSEANLSETPTELINQTFVNGVPVNNNEPINVGFPGLYWSVDYYSDTSANVDVYIIKPDGTSYNILSSGLEVLDYYFDWSILFPRTSYLKYDVTFHYSKLINGNIYWYTKHASSSDYYYDTSLLNNSVVTSSIGVDTNETISDLQAYTEDYEFTLQGVEGDTVEEVLNNVVDSVVTQPLPGIIIIPQPIEIPEPSPPPSPSPSPSPSPNPSPAPIIVPEYPPEYEPLFPDEVRPITTEDWDTWNRETFLPYIAPLTQISKLIQDAIDAIKDTITSIKDKITSSTDTTTDIIEDIQTEPDAPETYQVTLKDVFPFCIPFDIYNMVLAFNADPVAPYFEVPMHFPWVDIDYTWEIDLSDWSSVAAVLRELEYIAFCVGLAILTSKVIKW